MIINSIKNIFIKKNINNVNKLSRNIQSVELNSVGVLIDISNDDYTKELIEALINKGVKSKQIFLLQFKTNRSKEEQSNTQLLSYDEFSFFGMLNNQYAEKFIDTSFDVLINYYDNQELPLQFVCKKSSAKFKIGIDKKGTKNNHLTIDTTSKNVSIFVEEFFNFLNKINTK